MIPDHDPRWALVRGCPAPGVPDHVAGIVGDYATRRTLAEDRLADLHRLGMSASGASWAGVAQQAFVDGLEELDPRLAEQLAAYETAHRATTEWQANLEELKATAERALLAAESAEARRAAAEAALEAANAAGDAGAASAATRALEQSEEDLRDAIGLAAEVRARHAEAAAAATTALAEVTPRFTVRPLGRPAIGRVGAALGLPEVLGDVEELVGGLDVAWAEEVATLASSDALHGMLGAATALLAGVEAATSRGALADLVTANAGLGWAQLVTPFGPADGAMPPQESSWIVDPATGEVVEDSSGAHGTDVPMVTIPTLDEGLSATVDLSAMTPQIPTAFGVTLAELPRIDLPTIAIPPPLHYFSWFAGLADLVDLDDGWVEIVGWDQDVVAPVAEAQATDFEQGGGVVVPLLPDPQAHR